MLLVVLVLVLALVLALVLVLVPFPRSIPQTPATQSLGKGAEREKRQLGKEFIHYRQTDRQTE